jgi:hypothetical protein
LSVVSQKGNACLILSTYDVGGTFYEFYLLIHDLERTFFIFKMVELGREWELFCIPQLSTFTLKVAVKIY